VPEESLMATNCGVEVFIFLAELQLRCNNQHGEVISGEQGAGCGVKGAAS